MQSPETHGEFRAAPKNAVHFLYGAALHRPGEHPWTPKAMLSLFDAGGRGLWLEAFDKSGFLGAKAANETGIFFPEFSSAEFGALARGFW